MKTFKSFNEEISVNTDHYKFSGAGAPKGIGNWAFSKHKNHDINLHPKEDLFYKNDTYSAAKVAAKKYFKEKGHSGEIHLQT